MTTGRHYAVRVPATTANLGPGFDAFGAAVSLHLTARSVPRDGQGHRVVTEGEGAGEVATGNGNLVWRCVVALADHLELAVPDVALRVVNPIPLERGLGSSSAAIVAGLALGRALLGVAVGDQDLCSIATEIEGHPDNVVPAIMGGLTASVTGDDGRLRFRRVDPAPRLRPVVFVPTTRQLTTTARSVIPATLERAEIADQAARAAHVFGALAGLWPVALDAVGDRLHEPPRLEAMAGTGALVAGLRGAGVHAWLSGAGPSAAAAIPRADGDLLAACHRLGSAVGYDVRPLDWDLSGVVTCPIEEPCGRSGALRCVQCPAETV